MLQGILIFIFFRSPHLKLAGRCRIDTGFIEAVIRMCKSLKILTIKDSIVYGSQISFLSHSLELLTLASDTSQNDEGLKLYLHCPNLKQCHVNLSYHRLESGLNSKVPQHCLDSKASKKKSVEARKVDCILKGGNNDSKYIEESMTESRKKLICPALHLTVVCSELLMLRNLEYLALSTIKDGDQQVFSEFSVDDVDDSFLRKLVNGLPKLQTLSLEGSFRKIQSVEIEHNSLRDLNLINLASLKNIKLFCPRLHQLTNIKPEAVKLEEVELALPSLKKINLMPFGEEEKMMIARLARESAGLMDLNGVPLDENHPDAAGLIEGAWCAIA